MLFKKKKKKTLWKYYLKSSLNVPSLSPLYVTVLQLQWLNSDCDSDEEVIPVGSNKTFLIYLILKLLVHTFFCFLQNRLFKNRPQILASHPEHCFRYWGCKRTKFFTWILYWMFGCKSYQCYPFADVMFLYKLGNHANFSGNLVCDPFVGQPHLTFGFFPPVPRLVPPSKSFPTIICSFPSVPPPCHQQL